MAGAHRGGEAGADATTMNREQTTRIRAAGLFVAANAVFAFIMGLGFIDTAFANAGGGGRAFLLLATLAQTGGLCLLAGAPLLVVARLTNGERSRVAVFGLGALSFGAIHLGLYIDLIVYEMFRFHINGLALNLFTTPGGYAAMRLSGSDTLAFCIASIFLFIALYALQHRLAENARDCTRAAARRPWVVLAALSAIAFSLDRGVYAYADLRGDTALTRLARPIPLYLPVTIKRVASRWLGGDAAIARTRLDTRVGSTLRYPTRRIEGDSNGARPDIVWIVLDSWRHDAFNARVTPRIHALSERGLVFDRHYATGNATRFGIFGMFYGLHGVYWHPALAERRGPVLVDRLLAQGYRFKVITPSPLTFPEFRRTVFTRIESDLDDDLPGETLIDRHEETVRRFESFARQTAGVRAAGTSADKPFFSFLFFDSTHAPYDFPEDHAPFEPYAREIRYAERDLDSQRAPIFNRYRNAIHWLDSLTGNVVDSLRDNGLLDNTVVLITGDHGESFGENGLWGHNSAFTDAQIHVPLILLMPDREGQRLSHRTSHQDIAPTFMELLGVTNDPADYSNGVSLFERGERRVVSCGWSECAWLLDDGFVVFGTAGGNSFDLDVLDRDYRPLGDSAAVLDARSNELLALANDLGRFMAD